LVSLLFNPVYLNVL